ncbi:hypothetical protein [Bacillus litorisediminis]|uniref:hypothetical protein n=1 Tax=Bacillus litorisediminis TaxID=2922713 RepID=UPI001FADC75E|nr:hypothetical protein [Bacillus litorisediminis]
MSKITKEMLIEYERLNQSKKEIEAQMNHLKKYFHAYFDETVGENEKGELVLEGYKLQRLIRSVEQFDEEKTVERLEELNMKDLIQIVKRPDEEKIHAAINLGFLKKEDIEECILSKKTGAISVKALAEK